MSNGIGDDIQTILTEIQQLQTSVNNLGAQIAAMSIEVSQLKGTQTNG